MQPRPLVFNPPPPPQFQSVWSNPNAETYMQPPTMINPITQYVQVRSTSAPFFYFFWCVYYTRDLIIDASTLKSKPVLVLTLYGVMSTISIVGDNTVLFESF